MGFEANVRKVVPYVPGEQPKRPGMIKLNTNECPYPPAPEVAQVLEDWKKDDLRLYPDPTSDVLLDALSKVYHMPKDQIFVGVGSDDVLAMAFLTFFNSDKQILFPDITYSFYDVWADLFRIPYQKCALNDAFQICTTDYKQPNGGIIFPNPNAPTGVLMELSAVEEIVAANPDVVVIVDEAYVDFGAQSALSLVDKYENLLVVQTFSKSRAMAGMRIGYAFGSKKLIGYLNDAKFSFNSYTMNRPSLLAGAACVQNETYFKEITDKIIATREWTKKELLKLGFHFPDSYANFIFAEHESVPAEILYQALREQDIYVRYFKKLRIDNFLRISIGTEDEMKKLIEFLQDYLK